jgi:RNA polymerase sigma-70 factor (TIGR02943 family)
LFLKQAVEELQPIEIKKNQIDPEAWVENYGDYLFNFAYHKVHNTSLAEDLVQDTFLSGISAEKSYSGLANEKTWLLSILKNKIIDHYRKASTKHEVLLQLNGEDDIETDYFFAAGKKDEWTKERLPKDWGNIGSERAETNEFYQILEQCISKLPDKWQGIFSMSLIDDKSSDLVCNEFDLSPANFWVIMHRAKLQIRQCLEKNWIKV